MELLYILLILLVVTRAFGELAARAGQPVLVGELVGGIILGVVIRQSGDHLPVLSELTSNEVFQAITELGVFFLMLLAGLEMHPRDLKKASRPALGVALGGLLLPLAAGCLLGWAMLPDSDWKTAQVLFLGTSLAITAIPVAAKVLLDLGQLDTPTGRLIVSAALFDDIFGLILLGLLTGLLETGSMPGAGGFLLIALRVAGFFAVTAFLGLVVLPFLGRRLRRLWIDELEFSMLLVVGLLFSLLAELFGLHFILGAFIAGLCFTQRTIGKQVFEDVETKVSAVATGFLAPLFFASIGLHLDISALWHIPLFVALLVALAVVTKFLGAGLAARAHGFSRRESAGTGIAMSARGAVELIIAGIALEAGLFSHPDPAPPRLAYLFSAVVIMAVATTLFMPVGLRAMLPRGPESGENVD